VLLSYPCSLYTQTLYGCILPQASCYPVNRPFGLLAPKTLNYLAFQSLDFERTWWRLLQKRVVCTKFDIYVFITEKQWHYFDIFRKWQKYNWL